MATHTVPRTGCSQAVATLRVDDITNAIDFYVSRLGFTFHFTWGDPPSYAGVGLGQASLHFAKGTPFVTGHSEVNFIIDNADEMFAFHKVSGVDIVEPIGDRDYGLRDYKIRDIYGNYLGFGHYIYNQGPPVKIERVDISFRLEKRLAALLHDLAEHKHMSLSSCLEETLLHTFERIGNTVASPHSMSTLDYIEGLKKKHGIDYDTHASYRFVE
jgi:catechol 2,3-dioxygenase-like lactoylglutathione lyase family enzyme